MVRIGVIGCGWAGRHQAEAILGGRLSVPVELVAAAEADSARLARCGEDWGLPADRLYTDHRRLLERDDLDAVSVCLPTHLHHRCGLEVLASGRDLLVEKPMTMTVAQGRELVEAAARAGRVLMVAESRCFCFAAQQVPLLVADGVIGRPLVARSVSMCHMRGTWEGRPWLLQRRCAGGGMFMTVGVHEVAFLRRVLGEVVSVFARRVQPQDDPESVLDTVSASLQFQGGAIGEITCSLNVEQHGQMYGHIICGSEGTVVCPHHDLNSKFVVYSPRFGPQGRTFANAEPERTPFALEVEHFARCVAERSEPATSGADQLRSLAVIEAGYRSIASGQPVAPQV